MTAQAGASPHLRDDRCWERRSGLSACPLSRVEGGGLVAPSRTAHTKELIPTSSPSAAARKSDRDCLVRVSQQVLPGRRPREHGSPWRFPNMLQTLSKSPLENSTCPDWRPRLGKCVRRRCRRLRSRPRAGRIEAVSHGLKVVDADARRILREGTKHDAFNRWPNRQVRGSAGDLDLDLGRLYEVALSFGVDERYDHLSPGRQRINVGKRLRRVVPKATYEGDARSRRRRPRARRPRRPRPARASRCPPRRRDA